MAEYGVVLAVIAAVVVTALIILRTGIANAIQAVVQYL
jgi:Flp pilus assembly pilin Flp